MSTDFDLSLRKRRESSIRFNLPSPDEPIDSSQTLQPLFQKMSILKNGSLYEKMHQDKSEGVLNPVFISDGENIGDKMGNELKLERHFTIAIDDNTEINLSGDIAHKEDNDHKRNTDDNTERNPDKNIEHNTDNVNKRNTFTLHTADIKDNATVEMECTKNSLHHTGVPESIRIDLDHEKCECDSLAEDSDVEDGTRVSAKKLRTENERKGDHSLHILSHAPLNVKISLTDENQVEQPITTDDTPDSSHQSNGRNGKPVAARKQSKLAQSLRKAANPPPLDANYLKSALHFSEQRIKGRQLLYMKMGPMTLLPEFQFFTQRSPGLARKYLNIPKWNDEDAKWLAWMEVKFKEIAGDDGEIDLQEFKKALGVRKSFFAERFFELFDQDNSGSIELAELMDGLRMLTKGTPAQKLQFLFDVYDADGSGSIERDELRAVLQACMEESSLSLTEENLQDLTDVLFDAADEDESGNITFDELKTELEKHPGVIENLTISAAQWLKPPSGGKKGKARFRYFTKDYLRNNIRKVVYCFLYWSLNIVLFAVGMNNYRDTNGWVMVARGCGVCLNFNCMWVLVLMLRKTLTFLRMTKLCHVLPIDQHISFHKMTAMAIVFFTIVHTVAHIVNANLLADDDDDDDDDEIEMWEVLFTPEAEVGFVGHSAFITGWILDVILLVIAVCSLPFVRRSGHFQVFYWTHILYVPFWILVIIHGPNFWKWFVLPGAIFIMEKISRSKFIKMARYGDTYIEEVNLLSSGVTHLVITRPTNFRYQPGDYIFIQIPEIATYEWHPFTISSAPEMDGHIWLHVRSAGHWTNKLYEYFDKLQAPEEVLSSDESSRRKVSRQFENFERAYSRKESSVKSRASSKRGDKAKQKHKITKVKCYIDGPYGTGTREVFDTQHAVLIGAGIGVTPMASILQSVWYKFHATRQTCPKCTHIFYPEEDTGDTKLRKVDFIWINRDQKSFEWFLTLLNQIEYEQCKHGGIMENCIQMHMYMTAAQKKTDMKGIGLQMALDLMYEKTKIDLITGLRTKTEPGRPDWNKIFKAIKAENRGKVKIFFCGAPALGKTIKEAATKYNFAFSKENF